MENNETTVLEQEQTTTDVEQEKTTRTFTQDEVNKFVTDRLAKERKKYSDYEDLKAKAEQLTQLESVKSQLTESNNKIVELQNQIEAMNKSNEIRDIKDRVSKETGVPINLLTATTEEACKEQAQAILNFAKPTYPTIKDGGEVPKKPLNQTVEQQFEDWFNNSIKK